MNPWRTSSKITKRLMPGMRFRRITSDVKAGPISYNEVNKFIWIHVIEVGRKIIVTEEYEGNGNGRDISIPYGKPVLRMVEYQGKKDFVSKNSRKNDKTWGPREILLLDYVDDKAPLNHVYPALSGDAHMKHD